MKKLLLIPFIALFFCSAEVSASSIQSGITAGSSPSFDSPVTAGSVTVNTQMILGSGNGKSTFTATAMTLDDGLTLKVNGRFAPPSATEAVLKTTTPTYQGEQYWDSTNSATVVGTGTATCNDWGQINSGTTYPAGW